MNIRETAKSYELELAAPGLRKSDFRLKIDGDTLTISFVQPQDRRAEHQAEFNPGYQQEKQQPRWVRREFARQPFQRHFELGDTIDREKITARYDDGILYLTMPKKESLRPVFRQIDIN